jgi:hypothetical protein
MKSVSLMIKGTLGASCAYTLSNLLGRSIVMKYFPDKLEIFRREVSKFNKINLVVTKTSK